MRKEVLTEGEERFIAQRLNNLSSADLKRFLKNKKLVSKLPKRLLNLLKKLSNEKTCTLEAIQEFEKLYIPEF